MLEIRPALTEDAGAIQALIAGVYAEYGCTLNVEADEPHLLEPGAYFRARGGEFWVVEDADGIKATVAVLIDDDERASELKSLYVRASVRRRGWGRRLAEMTMAHARRAGSVKMFLWSDTRFVEAHRLYRSMGFRECGTRELHDSNNTVEFGFEMSLAERMPDV